MRDKGALAEAVASGRPITQAEAEAWVKQIERTCLGPLVLSSEEAAPWWARMHDEADSFSAIAAAMMRDQALVDKVCPYVGMAWFLPGGPREEDPKACCLRILCASIGCGEDMNAQILAGPMDGRPRDLECPRCGRIHPCVPAALHVVPEAPAAAAAPGQTLAAPGHVGRGKR